MTRRHMRAGWQALIVVALTIMTAAVGAPARADAVLHDGIRYDRGLTLDIYTPQKTKRFSLFSSGKRPVVVYVHGGGWLKGSRKKVFGMPDWLTRRGYVFVAIDYRKVPQTTIDGQVADVASAVKWVERNIGRYGGDGRKVALMGHSAGAHLVTMVAVRKKVDVEAVIANDVQGYDMVAYAGMRGGIGYPYLQAFSNDADNWVRWSPVTYVRRSSNFPPHLLMHSGSDGDRRRVLTRGYAQDLKRRGCRVSVFDGGRYSHGSIASHLGRPGDAASRAVEQFLARHIGR